MISKVITSTTGRLAFGVLIGATLAYVTYRGRMASKRTVLRKDVEKELSSVDHKEVDRLIDRMEHQVPELEPFLETMDSTLVDNQPNLPERLLELTDKYFNLAAGMVDRVDIERAITHKWVLDEDELSTMVKGWQTITLLSIGEDVSNKHELQSVYDVFCDQVDGEIWRLPKYSKLKKMVERDKRTIKEREKMLPERWSGKVRELSATHVFVDTSNSTFEEYITKRRNIPKPTLLGRLSGDDPINP